MSHTFNSNSHANAANEMTSKQTHYEVLNVAPTATRTELRESYVRLKNTYSTHNQALYSLLSDEEANALSSQVEEAFRVLNDDYSRRNYDATLGLNTHAAASEPAPQTQLNFVREYKAESSIAAFGGAYAGSAPTVSFNALTDMDPPKPMEMRGPTIPRPSARNTRAEGSRDGETAVRMQEIMATADLGDGATLRRLREMCGVSEVEMQDRTKVCIEYIRGLETNTYERLPRTVFVKGFLRSYCKYLAVPDSEKVVTAVAERLDHWQASKVRKI